MWQFIGIAKMLAEIIEPFKIKNQILLHECIIENSFVIVDYETNLNLILMFLLF